MVRDSRGCSFADGVVRDSLGVRGSRVEALEEEEDEEEDEDVVEEEDEERGESGGLGVKKSSESVSVSEEEDVTELIVGSDCKGFGVFLGLVKLIL